MKKRLSDIVTSFLVDQGVKYVFTVTGGGAMFLNDGVATNKNLNHISNHHEQACAMSAVGYSKYTNDLSAVMLTTGCGATNAVTGVLDAWGDNTPVIFISGQVKRKEASRNSKINLRTFGVQEADVISIVQSITKYSIMINKPEDILFHLEKATYLALSGRPGPVWIDIPLDVQGISLEVDNLRHFKPPSKSIKTIKGFDKFIELYNKSKRPIVLAGNGVRLSGSLHLFKKFISNNNLPCVVSYLGVDYFEQEDINYVGRIGIKGDRAGNFAIQNSDLIICLGSRLSTSQTGFEYNLFGREATLVVIDIDKEEHQKNTVKIDQFINADVGLFLEKVMNKISPKPRTEWQSKCLDWKNKWPVYQGDYDVDNINMYEFTNTLSKLLGENSIVVSDAGSAFFITSQSLKITHTSQRYITSGAQADMGFSLPAAIGACLASKSPVIGITGDGSFQMNIQELQTIKHHNLPIKVMVMNNGGYQSIRATQSNFFDGRKIGTDNESGISFPSVEKISAAYGLPFVKIDNSNELAQKLKKVINHKGPLICEVNCSNDQQIIPTVRSAKNADGSMISMPIEDMHPALEREEFHKEMIVKSLSDNNS